MSEGLITRIGKWIDNKWESKASERDMIERTQELDRMIRRDRHEVEERSNSIFSNHYKLIQELQDRVKELAAQYNKPIEIPELKDLSDLKTRLEKIELYSGMTRKVDPTKPPVVKSAFQI